MKYDKLIKLFLLILFIVGVVISFYGFIVGFEKNANAPVDNMLYCAYAYIAAALAAVVVGVVVIGGINNPMSLVKLLIGVVVIAVVIFAAYFLAPGTPAVGYMGEPVSDMTLKLTDTMLNLTYLLCGGAILSLLVGIVVSAIRK